MALPTGVSIERVTITKDAANAILETALNAGYTHGIGYWAEWNASANAIREHYEDPNLPRGPWVRLTRKRLAEGCRLALLAGHAVDDKGFDGPSSDIVIQYAVFGEQKYG